MFHICIGLHSLLDFKLRCPVAMTRVNEKLRAAVENPGSGVALVRHPARVSL